MSSIWGNNIKISIFGESHGEAIGAVIDSLPAGLKLDMDKILVQMARRAPGQNKSSTPRKEADFPKILSGVLGGFTTGAPLCAIIENTNTKSGDYQNIDLTPRPSHSDYPAFVKYGGYNDIRGGGHFSGRLTAPMVFSGSVCRQILEEYEIIIGGHIAQIGDVCDKRFDLNNISSELLNLLNQTTFATIDKSAKNAMENKIETARMAQDSVGGIVECAVIGLNVGIGANIFSSVESKLASILFSIPAVKGVEFGLGFGFAEKLGSEVNDQYCVIDGKIKTETNNNGGILGGMTDGAPLVVRVAFKPTPSISKPQSSVNLSTMENTELVIKGRHDPCIVGRALPVVEAAVAIGLLDLILENN